ncbi:ATP-binding protein [Paraburkholderia sp. D15]|uniref:AAA family ATPase n=1 Tax=Paraburkholderia sp. D15 TaxID=2880218 RepID=UPI002478898D|nr:ATP-binding protein [Paraburkholderia sp. D15]WGS51291.1 ATP-binding protein [Paraburkholderia sp. D15]
MTSESLVADATGHHETAVLHMVCGKIASGKSTLTTRLVNTSRAVLISEDKWIACLYPDEIQTLADYISRTARIRAVLTGHIEALLAANISVVLDFPFNTVSARRWGRSLFQTAGCEHRLHYLDVSDEICKSRLAARNVSGEHPFHTSEEQYDQISRYFVPPVPDEGFDTIVYDETGDVCFRTGP